MKKSIKFAINGSIGTSLFNAFLNAVRQFGEMNANQEQQFSWKRLLIATGKGALVGAAGGFVIGSIADYRNAKEEPINTDGILNETVKRVRLKKEDPLYGNLSQIADNLILFLWYEYNGRLAAYPFKHGSTEKGTALKDNYDIDICLKFKPDSFLSTKEMYYDLLSFLKNNVGKNNIIRLREQRKSIGVFIGMKNSEYKIDIVPYKLTNGRSSSGYLYVNNRGLLSDKSSYTKTDVQAIKDTRLTSTQKQIVLLLKNWRNNHNLPLSSHLLENLILASYQDNYGRIPRTLSLKTIMVFKFISDNLDNITIRSVENTNNVLTDLPESEKSQIISACKKV